MINSSPPRQNGRHFADNIFKCIFVNEKFCISIQISMKFAPMGPIDNQVQVQVEVHVLYWHIYIVKIQMRIDIAYKRTKCFGYNRDLTDNAKSVYIRQWGKKPWVVYEPLSSYPK